MGERGGRGDSVHYHGNQLLLLLYSSPSYERHKESPQKTVSQKGFALFGELKPLVSLPDYPPNTV